MKNILHEHKKSSITTAIICIILGIIMLIWPESILSWLCILVGILLLVGGIVYLGSFFVRMGKPTSFAGDLFLGLLLILLGILLLVRPGYVIAVIQYVFGFLILAYGILDLQASFSLHSFGLSWNWALVASIVTIALGILIIADPFGSLSALVILIGIVLIYNGASSLWLISRVSKAVKGVENVIDDQNAINVDGEVRDE